MNKLTFTLMAYAALFTLTTQLSACASPGNTGLVVGGVAGGVAGSALTNGNPAGTVAGAVGGALIGREVARTY